MEELIVLYEDNHIIVVLKPQNVPSVPDGSGDVSMYDAVKKYIKEKYDKPGDAFIGLVHRLDRPTGGIMVFARTSKAASRLSEQIRSGDVRKRYLAVTCGIPRERQARLTNYLVKDESTNTVRIAAAAIEGSKEAVLDYKVLETYDNKYALVSVELLTGRGHQIRVQMKGINAPLLGDGKYGSVGARSRNLALWAHELCLTHPTTKKTMAFKVFPPTDEMPWKAFSVEKYINVSKPNF